MTAFPAPHTMRLPAILDLKGAAPLRDLLVAARGRDVVVDASDVQRIGGLCLQVLLAGRKTWGADGHAFRIADPSPDFASGLALFGANALLTNPGVRP